MGSFRVGYNFRCVVVEADSRIVAVCADRNFTRGIGLQVLVWFPLEPPKAISLPFRYELRTSTRRLLHWKESRRKRDYESLRGLPPGFARPAFPHYAALQRCWD